MALRKGKPPKNTPRKRVSKVPKDHLPFNQLAAGRQKFGLRSDQPLPHWITTANLMDTGCPAGGGAEVIRNYDGSGKTRSRIAELRDRGIPDEEIYRILVKERKIW